MPQLALDFVQAAPRYHIVVRLTLFVLSVLAAISLIVQQHHLEHELKSKNSQLASIKRSSTATGFTMDEELKIRHAYQVQGALNKPWQILFKALEQAQVDNPDIRLLSVQPKPEKGQVLIMGQVPDFDALVKYIESLRKQQGLGEITLLNQHWEVNGEREGQEQNGKLMFNLSVIWLP